MICEIAQKYLSAYIDRQLPSGDKAAVASHLYDCKHCGMELQSLLQLKQWLRALPQPGLPDSVRATIEAQTILEVAWWEAWHLKWWIPSLAVAAFGTWFALHAYKAHLPMRMPQQLEAHQTQTPAAGHDDVAWHPAIPLSKDTQ